MCFVLDLERNFIGTYMCSDFLILMGLLLSSLNLVLRVKYV